MFEAIIADDAVFLSLALHKPQAGKAMVSMYLNSGTFRYAQVQEMERAVTADEAAAAWDSLFYESGPLTMALSRTQRVGAERTDVAAALARAIHALVPWRAMSTGSG